MKKKILACLCALIICVGIAVAPALAASPCFMAVNDTLLPLEEQYIPIAVNGQYYVPYHTLNSGVTGVELGIWPIYSVSANTLQIYNREQVLTFDLTAGNCKDQNGTTHAIRAVIRNGLIYIPVRFTCEYFGLTYSSRVTTYGPMVRIRSASSSLSDNDFVSKAQQKMEERLRDWRNSQAAIEKPAPTPTYVPVPTPSVTIPETDKSDVRTYLAFRAEETDGLDELLARLEYNQVNALFFFPADRIAEYDFAVRSVLCGGHKVGFLVSGTDVETIREETAQANRILAQIAHINTYMILAPNAEEPELLAEIEAAGLLCWATDLNAVPDGTLPYVQANSVYAGADEYSEKLCILSDTSSEGSILMGRLLSLLVEDNYALRLAVETEI